MLFRRILILNFFSSLLGGMWIAALNVTIFISTHSLALLSLVWVIKILTRLTLQPLAGALVDRWQTLRGLSLAFGLAAFFAIIGAITILLGVSTSVVTLTLVFIFQMLDSVTGPASGKFIKRHISNELLPRFNSLQLTYGRLAAIAGPSIGSTVIALGHIGLPILLLAYSISHILLSLFTYFNNTSINSNANNKNTFWISIIEGWMYAYKRSDLFSILILSATASGGWRLIEILVPLLAAHTSLGSEFSGPLYSFIAVGSIGMGILLSKRNRSFQFKWIMYSHVVNILPFFLFIYYPTTVGLAIAMIITGVNADFHGVVVGTYLQSTVPDEFYGRTSSLYRTLLAVGALVVIGFGFGYNSVGFLSIISSSLLVIGLLAVLLLFRRKGTVVETSSEDI